MSSEMGTSASSSSPPETGRRAAARCGHFGDCGGCSIQDLPYESQVEAKRLRVAALLSPFGGLSLEAHPSPDRWYYRNKMEFSFGDVYPPVPGGPTVRLGLKPKGRWDRILDLRECHLLSPEAPALLAAVRDWAEREGVPPYNTRRHKGLLRHLVVREAKNGPDRMVCLVTAPGELPAASFLEAARRIYPATTILRGVNGKLSDTAVSDALGVLEGPGHILETLRLADGGNAVQRLRFRISPHSFFQTNTRGAEVLYSLLRRWIRDAGGGQVLDLYCGGGGISLAVAGVCRKVSAVEMNPAAVEDGRANADLNAVSNVRFYAGSVELLLPALLDMKPEAVIADPPRAGLKTEGIKALLEAPPRVLLYVSCNPEALARDLALLKERYELERAAVVDLFPHTDHVETAVFMRRRG